jgi:hypothetical protein
MKTSAAFSVYLSGGRAEPCHFGNCQWWGVRRSRGREVNGVNSGLRHSFNHSVIGCTANQQLIFFSENVRVWAF